MAISHTPPDIESVINLVQKGLVASDGGVDAAGSVQSRHDLVVGVCRAVGGVDAFVREELVERSAAGAGNREVGEGLEVWVSKNVRRRYSAARTSVLSAQNSRLLLPAACS